MIEAGEKKEDKNLTKKMETLVAIRHHCLSS